MQFKKTAILIRKYYKHKRHDTFEATPWKST